MKHCDKRVKFDFEIYFTNGGSGRAKWPAEKSYKQLNINLK